MWSKRTATRAGFVGLGVAAVLVALGIYLLTRQADPAASATPSVAQRRVTRELARHDIAFTPAFEPAADTLIGEERAIAEVAWSVRIKRRSEPMLGFVTTEDLDHALFYAFRVKGRLFGLLAGPAMPNEPKEKIRSWVVLIDAAKGEEVIAVHGRSFPSKAS